jgi:O-antigen/teichoic acid export membrane protein
VAKERRFRTDAILMAANQWFLMACRIVIIALMTRLVSQTEMGVYFLVLQVVTVLRLFTEWGMPSGLQKLIAVADANHAPEQTRRYTITAAQILLTTTAIASAVIVACWPFISGPMFEEPLMEPFWWLAVAWLLLHGLDDMASAYFRARRQIGRAALVIGLPRSLFLLFALVIALMMSGSISLQWLMFLVLISWAISAFGATSVVVYDIARTPAKKAESKYETVREMLGLCTPLMLHKGAGVLYTSANMWILAIYQPTEDVGVFGSAMRLAASMALVLGVINKVLPARVAKLYTEGKIKQMEGLMRDASTIACVVAVPIALACIFFASEILGIAFTEEYASGATALSLLAVGHFFNVFVGPAGFLMQMSGGHMTLLRVSIMTAIVNVIAAFVLIPTYGIDGAAAAGTFSLILQNVWLIVIVRRKHGIWTVPRIPKFLTRKFKPNREQGD